MCHRIFISHDLPREISKLTSIWNTLETHWSGDQASTQCHSAVSLVVPSYPTANLTVGLAMKSVIHDVTADMMLSVSCDTLLTSVHCTAQECIKFCQWSRLTHNRLQSFSN